MVDLILRDGGTSEILATIRTSATFAKANELGAAFNIVEIHGLEEEKLDTQKKKDVNYALDKAKPYTIAFFKTLATTNGLILGMKDGDSNEVELVAAPSTTTTTTGA